MRKFCASILFITLLFSLCYGLEREENKPVIFLIQAPPKVQADKTFKVIIKATDDQGRVLTDYSYWGRGVEVSTGTETKIEPSYISASSFKNGEAQVEFTCDKQGEIVLYFNEAGKSRDAVKEDASKERPKIVYTINNFDEIEVSVWGAEGLTKTVTVSPDGYLSFPLIGEVKAAGLTLMELVDEITKRMSVYVKNPQVSVMIKRMGGNKVIVLGEVQSPGVVTLQNPTLLEAIGLAGGYTDDACTTSIVVMRGDLYHPAEIKILNLMKIVRGGKITKDMYLKANDVIFVPKSFIANYYYFMTRVLPGLSPTSFMQARKILYMP